MAKEKVNIYLSDPEDLAKVAFYGACRAAFLSADYSVNILPQTDENIQKADTKEALCLFSNIKNNPIGSLVMRELPLAGYWQIDKSFGTNAAITNAKFDHHSIFYDLAESFFNRLSAETKKKYQHEYGLNDFVLVLLDSDFIADQSGACVDSEQIVSDILEMEEDRLVLIRILGEVDANEPAYQRLKQFDMHDRVMFTSGQIDRLLAACSYVVTQDSDAVLLAMLHKKHSITYSKTCFHHITRKPYEDERLRKTYNRALRDRPEFQKYIFWLCRDHLINENSSEITGEILQCCSRLGW